MSRSFSLICWRKIVPLSHILVLQQLTLHSRCREVQLSRIDGAQPVMTTPRTLSSQRSTGRPTTPVFLRFRHRHTLLIIKILPSAPGTHGRPSRCWPVFFARYGPSTNARVLIRPVLQNARATRLPSGSRKQAEPFISTNILREGGVKPAHIHCLRRDAYVQARCWCSKVGRKKGTKIGGPDPAGVAGNDSAESRLVVLDSPESEE